MSGSMSGTDDARERAKAFRLLWLSVLDATMTDAACASEQCLALKEVMGTNEEDALIAKLSQPAVRAQLADSKGVIKTLLEAVPATVVSDADACQLLYGRKACETDVRAMFGNQGFDDDKAMLMMMCQLQISQRFAAMTAMVAALKDQDMEECKQVVREMASAEAAITDHVLQSLRALKQTA